MENHVAAILAVKSLDAPLDRGLIENVVDRKLRIDRKDHAPGAYVIVPRYLEQRAPFLRVRDVIGQCITMLGEIVARAQDQEPLLIREAREIDIHAFANLAASAITTDHPAPTKSFCSNGCGDCCGHPAL